MSTDRKEIERLHSNTVDRINDDLIAFQDATYELGRKAGRAESANAWSALESLVGALDLTNWSTWQTTAAFTEQWKLAKALLDAREIKP